MTDPKHEALRKARAAIQSRKDWHDEIVGILGLKYRMRSTTKEEIQRLADASYKASDG